MQSAFESIVSTGPTQSVKTFDGTIYYGIGDDDLVLSGNYELCVVRGAVEICGITLTSSSEVYTVAAAVPPFPRLRAVFCSSEKTATEPLHPELASFSTVVAAKTSTLVPNISALAPPYKSLWHYLHRVEDKSEENVCIEIPKSWADISTNESSYLVLGPKNSGKSGLCKFLCNRLLARERNRRIFYLELDPGQPEYTPPGFLSLHKIRHLEFSPSYAHPWFVDCIKTHYFGYVSPMEVPHQYLNLCADLNATLRQTVRPGDAVVVNTTGWTKGIGLELNNAILDIVAPALALQMGTDETFTGVVSIDRIGQETANGNSTITSGGFSSAELRNLQHLVYLHQHSLSHATEWQPYDLPLARRAGAVSFAVLNCEGIDLSVDLADCVEGTVVAINIMMDAADSEEPFVYNAADANDLWKVSTCVGLGIVQHLDSKDQRVRLLTPVDPVAHDLGSRHVVLIRGRVQLPVWEIFNKSLGDAPWVATARQPGIGANYTKFRRNIQR